uniref:Plasma membrane calcium-transporting ATPase 3 (Trinotate prediction) n=1 Tax=Henneguya salminicola TaxID=69463 RepID=A0A6G3MEG9_HENSL
MCVVVDIGDNKVRVLVKGAPDVLLCKCAKEFSKFAGEIEEISSLSLINIKKSISDMACDSLRTILLAFKDIPRPDSDENLTEQILVCDLILLTVVGIEDPVRPGVPDAIICCNRAGIVVRMVTGDNIVTAKSIAKKAGIIQNEEKELILDSQKFNQLIHDKNGNFNQDLFDKVWPKLKVLARSTPRDKYILVNGIVNTNLPNKQIVAVTGDGTNDAPALKRADVGFAMGIAGTDVAKEACDIIITDDNFLSIVKAIIWGRNVYDSISKFIQFQLTVNFVAILTSILTTAIYGTTLFHPAQFLWINLIMDTLASLALATENPTDDLLNRKPYSRDRSLLSKNMVVFIALHGIFQLTIIIIVIFAGPILFSFDNAFPLGDYLKKNNLSDMDTQHITFIFNIFVFMTLFNEINATKIHAERNVFRGNFKNKIFVSVIIITLILQFCIVQFTYTFFHVKPLNFELWMWSLFFGFSELIYHQIVVLTLIKMIVIPKKYRIQKGISSAIIISEEITQFDARVVWIRGFKKLQQEVILFLSKFLVTSH